MKNAPELEALAVRLLREVPGLVVHAGATGVDGGRDATFDLEFGGAEATVIVQVKHRVNPAVAWQLVRQNEAHDGAPLLVVADEMTAAARNILVHHGVGVVDSAGNAHVDLPGLLIHVEQRRSSERAAATPATRLTGRAGLVAQALLLDPERSWGVTDLAVEAGVSGGLAHRVLARLEREGLVQSRGSGPRRVRQLADATALVDLWAEENDDHATRTPAYVLAQTAQQVIARVVHNLAQANVEYALTGAAAGNILAPRMTAIPVVEIWVSSALPIADLCQAAGADAVDEGHNVVFLQARGDLPMKFSDDLGGVRVANRFRVYADLLRDPRRGREQAANLRQEVIGF